LLSLPSFRQGNQSLIAGKIPLVLAQYGSKDKKADLEKPNLLF
jgi:hypothetical protein